MRGIIPAMRSAVACRGNGLALTFGMEGPSVILFRGGETHSRSVTKAISWRALGTIDTFAISWFMTGRVEIAGSIVTKRRDTKVRKYNGGIPFTYGPLAYFLKNRLYIGETGHKDKWFPGEHAAIVDKKTFEQVQQLLASKSAGRKAHRTASEALLMGKLYDDRGNRMSPSFSAKNGVRYSR